MVSENAKCHDTPYVFGQLHLLTHTVIFLAELSNLIIVILTITVCLT